MVRGAGGPTSMKLSLYIMKGIAVVDSSSTRVVSWPVEQPLFGPVGSDVTCSCWARLSMWYTFSSKNNKARPPASGTEGFM